MNQFTIPEYIWQDDRHHHIVDRLIRYYLGNRAKLQEKENPGVLESIHKKFWRSQRTYFTSAGKRTKEIYIPAFGDIIQDLVPILAERNIHAVCELGTGDGTWLNHLSQQWPRMERFIGIDISQAQIHKNISSFEHIEFYCADLLEWVRENGMSNTLFHTNGGVLEYLSPDSVIQLLATIKSFSMGSLILFIEPIYNNVNFQIETDSRVSGIEYSYTHNYVHLLQKVGYELIKFEQKNIRDTRWMIVQAFAEI